MPKLTIQSRPVDNALDIALSTWETIEFRVLTAAVDDYRIPMVLPASRSAEIVDQPGGKQAVRVSLMLQDLSLPWWMDDPVFGTEDPAKRESWLKYQSVYETHQRLQNVLQPWFHAWVGEL